MLWHWLGHCLNTFDVHPSVLPRSKPGSWSTWDLRFDLLNCVFLFEVVTGLTQMRRTGLDRWKQGFLITVKQEKTGECSECSKCPSCTVCYFWKTILRCWTAPEVQHHSLCYLLLHSNYIPNRFWIHLCGWKNPMLHQIALYLLTGN